MADIHIIRDEGGIAAVEIREGSWAREGYIIFKSFADARGIWRGDDTKIKSRSLSIQQRQDAANEILASDRFTPEQKEEYYSLLSGRVFAIDYYTTEYRPGYYANLHPTVVIDSSTTQRRTLLNPLIDP